MANTTRNDPKQITLLIVDDEPHILATLTRLFRQDGFRVVTAGNGIDAVKVLGEHEYHVVISDHRMPGMMGDEFLRHVKQQQPEAHRILLTGYIDDDALERVENEIGVKAVVDKPWENAKLTTLARAACMEINKCPQCESNCSVNNSGAALNGVRQNH